MTAHRDRGHALSSYRLQLGGEVGFAAARALVPYLSRLGVTDCYTSPLLRANPHSPHGYDICDHGSLNPDLGTEADFAAFSSALRSHDLGLIVDFVPNHMAADPASNAWWRNVLENGPSSPFGDFFDVDWDPVKRELKGRVLLPVLGDQYGLVLERGEIQVRFADGTLDAWYGDLNLPLNPRQLTRVLQLPADRIGHALAGDEDPETREYLSILTALSHLPRHMEREPERIAERQREKDVARERLARLVESSQRVRDHVDACLRFVNGVPGDPASFDTLHDLLEHQAYRLAYWRTAFDEINYRRFFDVNSLVALRMEDPRVFEATHGLLGQLVASGDVTGIRVDHPDGLFDPAVYLERLQKLAIAARPGRAGGQGDAEFYVVVEKILSPGESLRDDWPVAGTTGYEFLNSVAGLFVDGRQTQRLRRIYARLTGQQASFSEIAYQSKRVITETSMASELNVLAHDLNRLSEADRRHRDFTLDSCRKALREVLACLPVYRTYVSSRGGSDFDCAVINAAIEEAIHRNPVMEESIFHFVNGLLLPPERTPATGWQAAARDRLRFAMAFQQLSGPVQAKGVEDTAFYRYHVLVAANDVGGYPTRLGVSPAEFHDSNQQRLAHRPLGMIATATHDTKRGEDARVRLAVLSEIPDAWRRAVSEWMRINGRHRTKVRRSWAPDRNDEYLFYQALVGMWPGELPTDAVPASAPDDVVARLDGYMQKAIREAKVHTSWIDQDQQYGRAVSAFVRKALTGRTAARFLSSLVPFARRVARVGAINSLAQLTLKIAAPGAPDFYQGTELWDLSLVDPDNRRSVDFDYRSTLLERLEPLLARLAAGESIAPEVGELLCRWPEGDIKMLLTASGLRFRRNHGDLMMRSAYAALAPEGPAAEHIVAFARHDDTGTLLAIVPRLVADFAADSAARVAEAAWHSTRIGLPTPLPAVRYRHVLTGEIIEPCGDAEPALAAADVFRTSPVALLWSGAGDTTAHGSQAI